MFKVGKPVKYTKSFEYDGENCTVSMWALPPGKKLTEAMNKAYVKYPITEGNMENTQKLMEELDALLGVDVVTTYIKKWEGVADAESNAIACDTAKQVELYEAWPILYTIAVEAIYNAIPKREGEVKN